jgi:hypothetical protein
MARTIHVPKEAYEPDDQEEWAEQPDYREPPLSIEGGAVPPAPTFLFSRAAGTG